MYPSISPSTYLSIYLSVCLSIYLSICKLENEAILRDVLKFWTWQHQKRSNSARLLHFSKLTTSKTKQFCETSFKNRKLSAALTASYQCVSRFFQSICLNYCACHEKLMPWKIDAMKCCTCHAKSSQQTYRSDAPKCNPSQEISARTSKQLWWTCLLYCACHGKCISADLLQMAIILGNATKPSRFGHFWQGAQSLAPATRNDIWTSKNGPCMVCFVHFHFEMCFAPQRHTLFRHLNLQKWSDNGVFCTFWLRNVLRTTTACTFSTSQLPKVVRELCGLYILTWKRASRHNGVHFFYISTSKSGPKVVCFVHFDLEMCFAPQRRAIFHLSSGQLAPHPPL